MKQNSNVFLTGSAGQLGRAIQAAIKKESGTQLHCYARNELDITNIEQLSTTLRSKKPDVVINCAAYTAVDKAESEREAAYAINTTGAINLAHLSNEMNFVLIHLSTDYVFAGIENVPRVETDVTNPVNYYGVTKLLAEKAISTLCEQHIILRVSGIFSANGHNFLKTILHLAHTKEQLTIVDDQITCPTYAGDIAEAIVMVIKQSQKKFGIYHYTNITPVSWYDFAKSIIDNASKEIYLFRDKKNPLTLTPISTCDYSTPAKRPTYAVLNCDKILRDYGIEQLHWEVGLEQSLRALDSNFVNSRK